MQLVGRLWSVDHPQARQLINGLISLIFDILKSKNPSIPSDSDGILRMLIGFLTMTPKDTIEKAGKHIKIFISSSAPIALVMLYMSPDSANKFAADKSVRSFKSILPKRIYILCTPIVLQFCKLLRGAGLDDSLYKFCLSSLGDMVESTGILRCKATAGLLALKDEIVSSKSLVPSPVRMLKDLTRAQFFVRLFPGGKTLAIQAHPMDLVEFIHYKIMRITGIPTADQRLIYKGKQLQSEQTLTNCGIQKDESMQLVGRMRSTDHPQAWQLINDLVSLIFDILKSNYPSVPSDSNHIIRMLIQFLTMTPGDNIEKAYEHIKIFVSSSAPAALVMLYMSPDNANKFSADESVRSFVNSFTSMLPKHICVGCARIVLEFCTLLRGAAGLDDHLYNFCRSSLWAIVDSIGIGRHTKELLALKDVLMFVCEVVVPELSHALELSKGSVDSTGGLSVSIVCDFTGICLH